MHNKAHTAQLARISDEATQRITATMRIVEETREICERIKRSDTDTQRIIEQTRRFIATWRFCMEADQNKTFTEMTTR